MIKPLPSLDYLKQYFYWDEDFLTFRRKKKTSNSTKINELVGYIENTGYRKMSVLGAKYYVHRLAYLWHYGIDPRESHIDHKDGNTLNNSKDNLRLADSNLTARNSKCKGYCWDKTAKKWLVQLYKDSKRVAFQRCDTEDQAIQLRKNLEIKHWGKGVKLH